MRFSLPLPAPLLVAIVAAGCGAGASRATPRVAVMPAEWETEPSVRGFDATDTLRTAFVAQSGAEVVPGGEVSAALAPRPDGCTDDPPCIRAVGEQVHASHAVAVRLAGLATTVVARVRLFDIGAEHAEASREEVVRDATRERLGAALASMARELVPPAPNETRWYARVWPWALIGALLVGAGVTAVVLAVTSGPQPDDTFTPP